MQAAHLHEFKGQHLWISPGRSIFWEEQQTLIVSDLHFGKTGHFRKSGIAVPQGVYKEDMQRLVQQLQYFQPRELLVVGDFFHSRENKELEFFLKWRNDFDQLSICLVRGNHDILANDWYQKMSITLEEERVTGDFCFRHEMPASEARKEHYYFSGHLHPGIALKGAGRQTLRFPCFYFGDRFAVLPAFSFFTGLAMIRPAAHESVFAIVDNQIVHLC